MLTVKHLAKFAQKSPTLRCVSINSEKNWRALAKSLGPNRSTGRSSCWLANENNRLDSMSICAQGRARAPDSPGGEFISFIALFPGGGRDNEWWSQLERPRVSPSLFRSRSRFFQIGESLKILPLRLNQIDSICLSSRKTRRPFRGSLPKFSIPSSPFARRSNATQAGSHSSGFLEWPIGRPRDLTKVLFFHRPIPMSEQASERRTNERRPLNAWTLPRGINK